MTPPYLGSLGILCNIKSGSPPFSEQQYCRRLSQAAAKYGLSVVVICPSSIRLLPHQVNGYILGKEGWSETIVPIPDVIYDRCFHKKGSDKRAISKLLTSHESRTQSLMWARGLPGKWQVYNSLIHHPNLIPYLPPTTCYTGPQSIAKALEMYHGQIFLKPQAGSQGKRTLYVEQTPLKDTFLIRGRDLHNQDFQHMFDTKRQAYAWIQRFIGRRPTIIQPYLYLTNSKGYPFDIRVLMQKNAEGQWLLTGMAVRQGPIGGITSNLHGGGTARAVPSFLTEAYGNVEAEHIITILHKLSNDIPPILENQFGRLGELGIDYGIDIEGNVWLLEVNSKPGRSSFDHIDDHKVAINATENPLRYTRYLLLRQLRRVNS